MKLLFSICFYFLLSLTSFSQYGIMDLGQIQKFKASGKVYMLLFSVNKKGEGNAINEVISNAMKAHWKFTEFELLSEDDYKALKKTEGWKDLYFMQYKKVDVVGGQRYDLVVHQGNLSGEYYMEKILAGVPLSQDRSSEFEVIKSMATLSIRVMENYMQDVLKINQGYPYANNPNSNVLKGKKLLIGPKSTKQSEGEIRTNFKGDFQLVEDAAIFYAKFDAATENNAIIMKQFHMLEASWVTYVIDVTAGRVAYINYSTSDNPLAGKILKDDFAILQEAIDK